MWERPESQPKLSLSPEETARLQTKYPHRYKKPQIDPSVLVATGVRVFGDVTVGKETSLWFNAVLRGDVNYIRIGERTNIQDLALIHVSYQAKPAIIGSNVTIGHSVILHACTVGDFSLVGMGSTVLDGAEIGDYVLLGAGSLVTGNTKIPSGMKAFGRPAKVVGPLTDEEKKFLEWSADHYVDLARTYR